MRPSGWRTFQFTPGWTITVESEILCEWHRVTLQWLYTNEVTLGHSFRVSCCPQVGVVEVPWAEEDPESNSRKSIGSECNPRWGECNIILGPKLTEQALAPLEMESCLNSHF